MITPVCIENNILVELEKSFEDEIISDGGIRFFQDTSFRPEWHTTIKGKVLSVPLSLTIGGGRHSIDPERELIRPIVKAGDEIIFSYLVIMNRGETNNVGAVFEMDSRIDPYTTTWTAPNGLKLIRVYLNNDKWECGLFNTKTKEYVDRVKGGESEVEDFMGKYMPLSQTGFNYRNIFTFEGKDYWMVDYSNAIAVKRAEGIFDMIGDYVLLDPIREPHRGEYQGLLEVYNLEQDTDFRAIGRIVSIGLPLKGQPKPDVKIKDKVVTDIRFVQKYEIDGKDYWVIHQKHLFGKATENDPTRST